MAGLVRVYSVLVAVGLAASGIRAAPQRGRAATDESVSAGGDRLGRAPVDGDSGARARLRLQEPQEEPGAKPPARGRLLTVTEGPDDAPAAGAEVEVVVVSVADALLWIGQPDPRFFAEPGPAGLRPIVRLTTDEKGQVRLPLLGFGARARARRGRLMAEDWLGQRDPVRLRLRLRPAVEALVVDAGGVPQSGICVVVGLKQDFEFAEKACALTGADGRALLPVPRDPREPPGEGPGSWRLTVLLPFAAPVFAPIDPADPPKGPVRLVLPPHGRLRLNLVRSDGTPFDAPALVRVRPTTGTPERDLPLFGDGDGSTEEVAAAGAVAGFPRVDLDSSFLVRVVPVDPALRGATVTLAGPGRSGDEAVHDVVCGGPALRVTGRLLDGRQNPVKGFSLAAAAGAPPGTYAVDLTDLAGSSRCVTGQDGRFQVRFDVDPSDPAVKDVMFDLLILTHSWERGVRFVRRPLPEGPRDGIVDLGDVAPEPAVVLAAGVVVDPNGDPVPGAQVSVRIWKDDDWVEPRLVFPAPARTRRDGRFELEGTLEPDDWGLVAEKPGWTCPAPAPFEPGDRELRIVVETACGIEGTFRSTGLAEGEVPWSGQVRVGLRRTGPPEPGGDTPASEPVPADVRGDRFAASSLRPGTYELRISTWDDPKGGLVIGGLEVAPGQVNRDPRIQDLDLGTILRIRTIVVMSTDDGPLEDASVAVRPARTPDGWSDLLVTRDGAALVTCAAEPFEVVACKSGYRSAWTMASGPEVALKLRRAPPIAVTLRLDASVPLPPAPPGLEARLRWVRETGAPGESAADWRDPRNRELRGRVFGADRAVTLTATDPGVYAVEVSVAGSDRLTMMPDGGIVTASGTIAVSEAAAQEFPVRLEPRDLEKLGEAGGRR